MDFRFIQDVLKDDKWFDYEGMKNQKGFPVERMKFWTNEMCRNQPNMFDLVITVSHFYLV